MSKLAYRRWFRFRLRTMLIAVAVVALPLAWIAYERRVSSREQEVARRLGDVGIRGIEFGGPYDSWDLRLKRAPQTWWRNLARHVLGERIVEIRGLPREFEDLTPLVGLSTLQLLWISKSQVSDLTPLADLTNLECLYLHQVPVRDLTPLAGLKNLESLMIFQTPVTDVTPLGSLKKLRSLVLDENNVVDISPLSELKQLSDLSLDAAPVSDLMPLAKLPKLKYLMIEKSPVSQEQIDAFKKAAPNCEILYSPAP